VPRARTFCYHATIKWDAVDALIDELGLEECGFCWRGAPTHQVPIDSGKLPAGSLMGAARRPLALCDECALLFQTGDRDLLAERSLARASSSTRASTAALRPGRPARRSASIAPRDGGAW
jgi:hypothetical protein